MRAGRRGRCRSCSREGRGASSREGPQYRSLPVDASVSRPCAPGSGRIPASGAPAPPRRAPHTSFAWGSRRRESTRDGRLVRCARRRRYKEASRPKPLTAPPRGAASKRAWGLFHPSPIRFSVSRRPGARGVRGHAGGDVELLDQQGYSRKWRQGRDGRIACRGRECRQIDARASATDPSRRLQRLRHRRSRASARDHATHRLDESCRACHMASCASANACDEAQCLRGAEGRVSSEFATE